MGGKLLKFELLKFKIRIYLYSGDIKFIFKIQMCIYITMNYIETKHEVQIDVTYLYNVIK